MKEGAGVGGVGTRLQRLLTVAENRSESQFNLLMPRARRNPFYVPLVMTKPKLTSHTDADPTGRRGEKREGKPTQIGRPALTA